jgi:tetratricopeptide (TPR) repeat protein
MPDLPKTVVRLAAELLKHQAKNVFGDEFLNIISNGLIDVAGENITEKLNAFLDTEDKAEKLLAAFKDADATFLAECEDYTLRQMVISKPLAALTSLESLATKLPKTLDDQRLREVLREQFAVDWPNVPQELIRKASDHYKKCLDRALAAKCDQILPTIFRKLDHIESTTDATHEILKEMREKIDSLTEKSIIQSFSLLFTIAPPPVDFTGRSDEVEELLAGFQRGASISGLTGGGGIGKTAFARVLAHRLSDKFPDARIEIDLQGAVGAGQTPLTTVEVMQRIIRPFYPNQKLPQEEAELRNMYIGTLNSRRVLLLLDNAHDTNQVRPLLPPLPSAAIVTSRSDLSGLSASGLRTHKLGLLSLDEAHELLQNIVPQIQKEVDEDINIIVGLCGYLPLALRVAGSLLQQRPDWKLQTLIMKLQDERTRPKHLKLLDDANLDVETSLSLSYSALNDEMKRLFRILGVFPAPFDLSAVCASWNEAEDTCDSALGQLIQFNLIEVNSDDPNPYTLHDLTRLYAKKLLSEQVVEESEEASLRHSQYYLNILEKANQLILKGGNKILDGLKLFDTARKNIEVGQEWSTQNLSDLAAARLCSSYGWQTRVLSLRLLPQEEIRWIEKALIASKTLGDREAEGAHIGNLGLPYYEIGENQKAISNYEEALVISRELDNRRNQGLWLNNLGLVYKDLGRPQKAREYFEDALVIARDVHNRRSEGNVLNNLGLVYDILGESNKAIEYYETSLVIVREIGYRQAEGNTLMNIGNVYNDLEECEKSIDLQEQALVIFRDIGHRQGEGKALMNIGNAYKKLGDARKAIEYQSQALIIFREIGSRINEGHALGNLGQAYGRLGDTKTAIDFYEKRIVIAGEVGDKHGEANDSWNMGLLLEKQGDFLRAAELLQVCVDFEQSIGHPNAKDDAEYVERVRQRAQNSQLVTNKPNNDTLNEQEQIENEHQRIYKKYHDLIDNAILVIFSNYDNRHLENLLSTIADNPQNNELVKSIREIVYKGRRVDKRLTTFLDDKEDIFLVREILRRIEQARHH